jgi:hypothetical protein
MSNTLAVMDDTGYLVGADGLVKEVKDRITAGRDDRKRYEPTWHSNLAFASGKFWLKWNVNQRALVFPTELYGKELYSTDVITEYRTTALGELGGDDDRPQLLLRKNDQPSEDFQQVMNQALAWAWDYEIRSDDVLEEVRRMCLDLGTAGVRCRFDPTMGPVIAENVPHVDGVPILNEEDAIKAMASGPTAQIEMKPIRQGRIVWEPLSPFNLIVPGGVPNERDFPWECVVRPVPLGSVKAEYGDVAADLKEDTDIHSMLGLDSQSEAGTLDGVMPQGKPSNLKGHVWLFNYFERPSPKFPDGRTIIFAGNKMKVLRVTNKLPYKDASDNYVSGITYFHWWRVTGRFWSRSLVESMKDPQRIVNKRRTQINEIIDRGLPWIAVERNSNAKKRKGLPMEIIELEANERQPFESKGISPGEWMYHDIQEMRVDIEHATGIRGPRLGENPVNVTTYAQLALLNENDQVKRMGIVREHKSAIGKLVEATVYDMRTYWGPERVLTMVSDDDDAEAFTFNATQIPSFFIVKVAKGAVQPRSQAAEIKKIEDIWAAAIASSAFMADPHAWVTWLKESLEAGQALDLPEGGIDVHSDKAELENSQLDTGATPPVQYYDLAEVHIPIHREGQIDAELAQDIELWSRYEAHIQQHVLMTMEAARQLSKMAPEPPPMEGAPGGEEAGPPAGPPA